MAAPTIPLIRLGLIGAGLAVEKPHWPALRRHVVSALNLNPPMIMPPVPLGDVLNGTFRSFSVLKGPFMALAIAVLDSLPGQHISSSASFAA